MSIYIAFYTGGTRVFLNELSAKDLIRSLETSGVDILMESGGSYSKIASRYETRPTIERIIGPLQSAFVNVAVGTQPTPLPHDGPNEWVFVEKDDSNSLG